MKGQPTFAEESTRTAAGCSELLPDEHGHEVRTTAFRATTARFDRRATPTRPSAVDVTAPPPNRIGWSATFLPRAEHPQLVTVRTKTRVTNPSDAAPVTASTAVLSAQGGVGDPVEGVRARGEGGEQGHDPRISEP
jgi:hypothetical protein